MVEALEGVGCVVVLVGLLADAVCALRDVGMI